MGFTGQIHFVRTNTDHSLLPDSVDKASVFVQIKKVNTEGKIDRVSVLKELNDISDKEAVRVVKSIPDWDVLYSHGEPYNLIWTIPVILELKE